jgi:hypothetical protein
MGVIITGRGRFFLGHCPLVGLLATILARRLIQLDILPSDL